MLTQCQKYLLNNMYSEVTGSHNLDTRPLTNYSEVTGNGNLDTGPLSSTARPKVPIIIT